MPINEKLKHFMYIPSSTRSFFAIYYKLIVLVILIVFGYFYREAILEHPFLTFVLRIIIYYLALNLIFNYGRLFIIYLYLKRNKLPSNHYDNFILGIDRLSLFLNHLIFAFIFIYLIGIDILNLMTTLSIIAVALVLIFKEYIANFLNGISLMFSNDFKLKDYVKIGEHKGRINNISFQNVELRTESGDYVYVPNSTVFTKEVTNYSKTQTKNFRVEFTIASSLYPKYPELRKELTKALLKEFPDILSSEGNLNMRIEKLEKESAQLSIEFITGKYSYKLEDRIKTFATEFILNYLSKINKKTKK